MKNFICYNCNRKLIPEKKTRENTFEVLCCKKCKIEFPIIDGIPRFVNQNNYANSFGYQWNKYKKTQLDSVSKLKISENRFYRVTCWDKKKLKLQKVLEAGCGAGRFTEVIIKTGAEVYSFDYSDAVEANFQNNFKNQNLVVFQANIFSIPLESESFDKIFCLGVLQHTPNPKKAFKSLVPYLKPGGEICIDVYDFSFRTLLNLKYWFRPITKRIKKEKLYSFIFKVVPFLFPIKMFITENIPLGKYFAFFIPIAYHKGFIKEMDNMTYKDLLEWSILDTFDKYAPMYDKPKTIWEVRKWFNEKEFSDINVSYGPNGIIAKARKK